MSVEYNKHHYQYAICRADRIGVIGFANTLEEAVEIMQSAPVLCDVVSCNNGDAILTTVYNWRGRTVSAYPPYEEEG